MKTDAELVASAVRGSQDAFRELVRRFERPVYSLVLRMVQDPATAEDLAQEVFVKAFRALGSYDPRWKFSSWLFKIAHNTTIDHLRRGGPETVPLEAGEDEEGRGGLAAVLADGSAEDPGAVAERHDLAQSPDGRADVLRPRRLVPGDLRGHRPAARHGEDQPPPGAQGARPGDDGPRLGPW
jgi:RNA polymerase sigma factor (sigma-70 family)